MVEGEAFAAFGCFWYGCTLEPFGKRACCILDARLIGFGMFGIFWMVLVQIDVFCWVCLNNYCGKTWHTPGSKRMEEKQIIGVFMGLPFEESLESQLTLTKASAVVGSLQPLF